MNRFNTGDIVSPAELIKKTSWDLTEDDRQEIARLITEGFTSGILDDDNFRIVWELNIN